MTGGAGFLGRAILRELDATKPDSVRVLDLGPCDAPGVEARVGDVSDYATVLDACRDVDLVIHGAAMVDWGHATRQRLEDVNVGGTRNVLRACREAGVDYEVLDTARPYADALRAYLDKRRRLLWERTRVRAPPNTPSRVSPGIQRFCCMTYKKRREKSF